MTNPIPINCPITVRSAVPFRSVPEIISFLELWCCWSCSNTPLAHVLLSQTWSF